MIGLKASANALVNANSIGLIQVHGVARRGTAKRQSGPKVKSSLPLPTSVTAILCAQFLAI